MKRFLFCVALMAVAASFGAVDVVGKWDGKIKIDIAAVQAKFEAQELKEMARTSAERSMRAYLTLQLRKDGTFRMHTAPNEGRVAQDLDGTWSQAGNKVTLISKKRNGEDLKKTAGPQVFTLDKTGKKMTLVTGPGKTTVTFMRL